MRQTGKRSLETAGLELQKRMERRSIDKRPNGGARKGPMALG